MKYLSASILSADFANLGERIRRVIDEAGELRCILMLWMAVLSQTSLCISSAQSDPSADGENL